MSVNDEEETPFFHSDDTRMQNDSFNFDNNSETDYFFKKAGRTDRK